MESPRSSPPNRHVDSLLAVSRRINAGGALPDVLDDIAREATRVAAGAQASSILLKAGPRWDFGGGYGLSPEYGPLVRKSMAGINGVLSAYAVENNEVITIADTETDPRFLRWRAVARTEGYRSTASFPLRRGERSVGALNVYRLQAGRWDPEQVQVIKSFADHAQTAIETGRLLDDQREQVGTLRRLVRTLEEQGHEHANRLQAISGLLALGEYEEAQRFLESLEVVYRRTRGAVNRRVKHPVLSGLLVAESAIAYQRKIELEIDGSSRLANLPATLSDTQVVSIIGNLLDNAFDAVAEMPPARRRVRLSLSTESEQTQIEVRDWGTGVSPAAAALIFQRGVSGKQSHSGVGLAVVESVVASVGGSTALRHHEDGTSVLVTLPIE